VKGLKNLSGELADQYYLLHGNKSHPCAMDEIKEESLRNSGNLFQEPDSTLLLSSGCSRHWPDARGIYHNEKANFFVCINVEDRISDNIKPVFSRFKNTTKGVKRVLKNEGYDFMHNEPPSQLRRSVFPRNSMCSRPPRDAVFDARHNLTKTLIGSASIVCPHLSDADPDLMNRQATLDKHNADFAGDETNKEDSIDFLAKSDHDDYFSKFFPDAEQSLKTDKKKRSYNVSPRSQRSPSPKSQDSTDVPNSDGSIFVSRSPESKPPTFECVEHGRAEDANNKLMEDRLTLDRRDTLHFMGCFDGHGGTSTAEMLASQLHKRIFDQISQGQSCETAIRAASCAMEQILKDVKLKDKSGSCAAFSLLDTEEALLHIGNLGDCRVVLSRKGQAVDLTLDQKPDSEFERIRLEAAGIGVTSDGRLPNGAAVARAFGDFDDQQKAEGISAEVAYGHCQLCEGDEFVLVGCDGIFDVLSSSQAVKVVRRALRANQNVDEAAKALVAEALRCKSTDNLSVGVLVFRRPPPLPTNRNSRLRLTASFNLSE